MIGGSKPRKITLVAIEAGKGCLAAETPLTDFRTWKTRTVQEWAASEERLTNVSH